MMSPLKVWTVIHGMNRRVLAYQVARLVITVLSTFAIWKVLCVSAGTDCPIAIMIRYVFVVSSSVSVICIFF